MVFVVGEDFFEEAECFDFIRPCSIWSGKDLQYVDDVAVPEAQLGFMWVERLFGGW
jgi:hypothetical protein